MKIIKNESENSTSKLEQKHTNNGVKTKAKNLKNITEIEAEAVGQAKGSLEVVCNNLENNPKCPHGPTLLFRVFKNESKTAASPNNSNIEKEFYACSAFRDRQGCNFYLDRKDLTNEKRLINTQSEKRDSDEIKKFKINIQSISKDATSYCFTCNMIFNSINEFSYHKNHEKMDNITEEDLKTPTKFLRPLSNDKAEAQYFFEQSTLDFFVKNLKYLKITKIICIGVPRLHEYLRARFKEFKIRSILLDFDYRFSYFNNVSDFFHYNMFNNWFFEGETKKIMFNKFLKLKRKDSLLVITDPPFGCRTEPLVNTMKILAENYRDVNKFTNILPIFWIFPYFMKNYIKKIMPEMEMTHYKINYENHLSYRDFGNLARKYGSPVRLFTNIPINLIQLPEDEGYKFCNKCVKWTELENIHCNYCHDCPSQNGQSYRHCFLCCLCVKPNYKHCDECRRCTQVENHVCKLYQEKVTCWICRKQGHIETNCKDLIKPPKNVAKKSKKIKKLILKEGERMCLVCRRKGHNELKCPRNKFPRKI